jgi:hypothetical protein
MNLKNKFFTGLFFLGTIANAQTQYKIKLETAYLPFASRGVKVDPGPNWKGYYLPKNENAVSLNLVNGIVIRNRLFVGLGLGYFNFEGIDGLTVFSDFEYYFFKNKKIKPFLNLNIGYCHIWNQYDGGTATGLVAFGAGLQYQYSKKMSFGLQSGPLFTQQALFYPIRLSVSLSPEKRKQNPN